MDNDCLEENRYGLECMNTEGHNGQHVHYGEDGTVTYWVESFPVAKLRPLMPMIKEPV